MWQPARTHSEGRKNWTKIMNLELDKLETCNITHF